MLLQRLNFGAAVFVALTLACSDDDSSRITAQRLPTASLATANVAPANHAMDQDDQIKWGPAPAIFPPGAQFAVEGGMERFLRLPFTGHSPEVVDEAVQRLALAWDDAESARSSRHGASPLVA